MLSSSSLVASLARRGYGIVSRSITRVTLINTLVHDVHWKSVFGLADQRDQKGLREPRRQQLSYRFKGSYCGEEHRTFRMITGRDGKPCQEEFTKIPVGWAPKYDKMPGREYDINATVAAGVLQVTAIVYFLVYWLIREPLRALYYKLDRHRVRLERSAEIEELAELEYQAHLSTEGKPTAVRSTYDPVVPEMSSAEVMDEISWQPRERMIAEASNTSSVSGV